MSFFRRFQRRHTTMLFHHTDKLTNTLTFTHTHDWPSVASRSSGSWGFSGFANGFFGDHTWSTKYFWPTGGHATFRKHFPQSVKIVSVVMFVVMCRHYAANLRGFRVGQLLNCKAQLLEINCVSTAR